MTAVLPEIADATTPRSAGRHRAPEDATTGSMGIVPADRRARTAHGRSGGRSTEDTGAHPLSRAAKTAGLSLAALGAVATAGGMATHGLLGDQEPPATGETALSPQLASANLAVAPAAHDTDAATSSVLPVVNSGATSGASSIKHDSPDSRAAAQRTAQQARQSVQRGVLVVRRRAGLVLVGRVAAARRPSRPLAASSASRTCGAARARAASTAPASRSWPSRRPASSCRAPRGPSRQAGQEVAPDSLKPGDLIFFNSPVSHVGIYIGNGKMIEAPQSGDDVKTSSVARRMDDAVGARRSPESSSRPPGAEESGPAARTAGPDHAVCGGSPAPTHQVSRTYGCPVVGVANTEAGVIGRFLGTTGPAVAPFGEEPPGVRRTVVVTPPLA